jgi:hypothetical protein
MVIIDTQATFPYIRLCLTNSFYCVRPCIGYGCVVRPEIVLNVLVVCLRRFPDGRLAIPAPRHARDETICQTEPSVHNKQLIIDSVTGHLELESQAKGASL